MREKKEYGLITKQRIMIKKYYRVLVKLPSTKLIIGLYAILLPILFIFNKVYFIFIITQTVAYIIYSTFTKTLLNYRRLLALSMVSTMYAMALDYVFEFGIGLASSIALQTIILVGLDGPSLTSYIAPPTTYFVTIGLTQGFNKSLITTGVFTTMYIAVFDYLIYKYISRYSVNGYSSFEIGRSFLKNRMEGSRDIEVIFEKLSKPVIIKPCLFISDKVAVAYTDLHYGPFYNTGSSDLPSLMMKSFENKGYDLLVLHGAGSHERDLPKSVYNQRIIDKFVDKLGEADEGFKEKIHGFFHVKGGDNWEAIGVVFEKTSLIFLSRPYGGIDDIPYYVQEWVDNESIARGLGRVLIIDSHNWELSVEPDYEALKTMLSKSIELIAKVREVKPSELLVRHACVEANMVGLIGGRICGLELVKRDNGEKLLLLYLRGNNMEKGLRNEIIRIARGFYKSSVIIEAVSNDEHSETGVYSATLYKPISCKRGLENVISELMSELSTKDYSENWVTMCFEDKIPLLQDGAYKLMDILKKTYPRTAVLLLILLATTPFIALLFQYMFRM